MPATPLLPARFGYKGDAHNISVGVTATRIDTPLGNRTGVLIRNTDASKTLYIGFTTGVTTANGWPIDPLDREQLDFGPGIPIYGIVASGTVDARVIEAV